MATHRREKATSSASVLLAVEHTGRDLLKLVGVADALSAIEPNGKAVIPRTVLLKVMDQTASLHALLMRHVTELSSEATPAPAPAKPAAEKPA